MRFNLLAKAGLLAAVMGIAAGPMSAMATTPPSASFEVGSLSSNLCMEAGGYTGGSSVLLDTCNGQINQKFYINRAGYAPSGQIAYTLESAKRASFQCVNDINKSTAPGSAVNLEQCNGINSAERFLMNGSQLYNIASGECLDSSTLGQSLVLNPCNVNAASQVWIQTPNNSQP